MKTDPNLAEASHLKGLAYRRSGDVNMAIEAFQKAIAICGDRAEFYKNLGNAYADAKSWDLSLKCFQMALQLSPNYLEAWYDKGCAMQSGGFMQEAIDCYRHVLKIDPQHSDSLNNFGLIMEATGQIEQAQSCYQRAVQTDPMHYIANINLGNIFRQKGNTSRALSFYERAISVKPGIADAYNNKGFALWDLKRYAESIESFATAYRLAPESDEISINYANALLTQGRPRRAMSCYRLVLKRNPENRQAIFNMGLCHESTGDLSSAIACYRQALKIDNSYSKAQSLLVTLLKKTCQWDELESASEKLDRMTEMALVNGEKPAETPFLNISRHIDCALNYNVARAWSKPIEDRYRDNIDNTNQTESIQVKTSSRLTIGYLSCNFRNHPTAQLMAGLIARHDRRRFKVLCYSYGIDDASLYREEIRKASDQFIDLRDIGDVGAAKRIRSDGVDILVDLGGYTKDSRMEIAAQRPAALQVRYLGLAGTTGADFFDYLVTDKTVTPPQQAAFYSERFIYMPDCYQVNNYQDNRDGLGVQRSDYALPTEGYVYCAFHSAYKIDYPIFNTWMRILKSVEKSVLWLCIGDPLTRMQLIDYAGKSDIQADRLIFADNLPKNEHLQRLCLADTALDTVQVTGAATTSDALWANVPVVTMIGQHFASRMSASILSAFGLTQLITTSLQAYEELAIQLAIDPHFYYGVREELCNARTQSPLFDTNRFTRHLEKGFEMIWDRYQKGKPPSMVEVPTSDWDYSRRS